MNESEKYPVLEVDLGAIRTNSLVMNREMRKLGLSVCGVIKVTDCNLAVVKAYHDGGCSEIGSSRIRHLKRIKEAYPEIRTLLLRIPMLSEAADAVRYADISLNSEAETLKKLNCEAKKAGVSHSVILMVDVGDRREGTASVEELLELGRIAEKSENLHLLGIGTNYGCVSGVVPDAENLAFLQECCDALERELGRKLEIVSGGNSTLLTWILSGKPLPACINHIRTGGTVINPLNMKRNRGLMVAGETVDTVKLTAEVVEVKVKPSVVGGHVGMNWKGEEVTFPDQGDRKRAILALGSMDVGDCFNLIPMEAGIDLIACSSDHTVLDVTDAHRDIRVGDTMSFSLKYSGLLYAFSTKQVRIAYTDPF